MPFRRSERDLAQQQLLGLRLRLMVELVFSKRLATGQCQIDDNNPPASDSEASREQSMFVGLPFEPFSELGMRD